jgi:hypothetical protein
MKTETIIAPVVPNNRPVTRVICDALALMPAGGTVADLLVPYLHYRGITVAPEKLDFVQLHQCKRSLKANLRDAVQLGYAVAAGMRDRKTVYVLGTPKPREPKQPKPAKITGAPKDAEAEAMAAAHAKAETPEYKWTYCPPGKATPPRFVPVSTGWRPPAMACARAEVPKEEKDLIPSLVGGVRVPHRPGHYVAALSSGHNPAQA